MSKTIELTQGKVALVDDDDFDRLSKYKWYALKNRYCWYAARHLSLEGKPKSISMHRDILRVKEGKEVDHINGDGLDNQKANLREVSRAQNGNNSRPQKNCTSRFKGVYWNKTYAKWQAKSYCGGKGKSHGYFDNEVEAAKAYDFGATNHIGEYARLNFSSETAVQFYQEAQELTSQLADAKEQSTRYHHKMQAFMDDIHDRDALLVECIPILELRSDAVSWDLHSRIQSALDGKHPCWKCGGSGNNPIPSGCVGINDPCRHNCPACHGTGL